MDKIRQFLKKKTSKIKQFIASNEVEITAFIGVIFISIATYKINFIAFLYVLGFIFISLSAFLLKFPKRR